MDLHLQHGVDNMVFSFSPSVELIDRLYACSEKSTQNLMYSFTFIENGFFMIFFCYKLVS